MTIEQIDELEKAGAIDMITALYLRAKVGGMDMTLEEFKKLLFNS